MHIVLVDDEPLFLNTVADFLKRCGHNVIAVDDGMQAITKIGNRVGSIDLVISDICMPKTDGATLLRSIKQHHPDIDVILVTAFSASMDATTAIKEGACALLHKPVKLNELEVVISQVETRRTERAQLHEMRQSYVHHQQQIQDTVRDRLFARRLHTQSFPRDFSFMPRSRFQLRHLPQGAVGGDFADVRAWGKDQALIMVADVSGHGTPAAFGGIALKTWFSSLDKGLGLQQVLRKADRLFDDIFPPEYYATAFCAIYDERERRLDYCLAGHPAPLLCSPTSGVRLLEGGGAVIGLDNTDKREEYSVTVRDDEVCLAFTDGLIHEPAVLARAIGDAISKQHFDARLFADLGKLLTGVLDQAIGLDPLRAFADDLTMLSFGPALPQAPDNSSLAGRLIMLTCQSPEQRRSIAIALDGTRADILEIPICDSAVDASVDCKPDLLLVVADGDCRLGELLTGFERQFPGLPVLLLHEAEQEAAVAPLSLRANVAGIRCWPCPATELVAAAEQALLYDPDRDRVEIDQVGIDWMDFVIASSHTSLDLLGRYLEAIARQPIPPTILDDVMYCVKEIAGNAIEWGNLRNPDFKVRISTVILPDRVMIKITDEGSGFQKASLFGPDQLLESLTHRELTGKRPGGFGLNIVRERMDKVEFNERGNTVVMCKLFTSSPPIDDDPRPSHHHPETVTMRSALDRRLGSDEADPEHGIEL